VLQFDDENYERVKRLVRQKSLGVQSEGDVIREAVGLLLEIADQEKNGYTQLVVRDPKRRLERKLIIPSNGVGVPA